MIQEFGQLNLAHITRNKNKKKKLKQTDAQRGTHLRQDLQRQSKWNQKDWRKGFMKHTSCKSRLKMPSVQQMIRANVESERDESDITKKRADSTGKVMHI